MVLYFLLLFCLDSQPWYAFVCIYLISETFIYLLGLIFLSEEYRKPVSYKRNVLMTIINFIEITLGFAVIYYCTLNNDIYKLTTNIDAIYYSFVTATTLGYGDMYPITDLAKITCLIQSIISFLFTIFIIGRFISNFDKVGYINKKKSNKGK